MALSAEQLTAWRKQLDKEQRELVKEQVPTTQPRWQLLAMKHKELAEMWAATTAVACSGQSLSAMDEEWLIRES